MSDPVRDFYTSHPYPPPVDNLDRARDEWRDANRHRAEHHLFWPDQPYHATLDILVAGCGTWQAAKYAVSRPDARVAGIDVSPTSITHTQKLQQQYSLSNLEVQQLPIEHVDRLDREFDLIVCTGVLHHLEDPDQGLRALRSVLKPQGAMYLMLYAPYGRAGVYMLQEYCQRLGVGTSPREIDDLVATLESLPQQHPLATLLRGARDARNADALADALLNPRDRAYSVPQLFEFIERNGLSFGRWYWQAPYLPQCGAIATTPHAKPLAALAPREQYRLMELWRGTMTTHSIIAYHANARDTGRAVRFDDDRWVRFVPVRLPWTRLIQERLPQGATGVLLNQSHPFHDLIIVLDQHTQSLFDNVDGHRRITDLLSRTPTADRARARTFFERLWWYDQVAFDTSNA